MRLKVRKRTDDHLLEVGVLGESEAGTRIIFAHAELGKERVGKIFGQRVVGALGDDQPLASPILGLDHPVE